MIGEVMKAEVSCTEADVPTGPDGRRAMTRNLESRPPNPFVLAEKENILSIICKSKPRIELWEEETTKTEGLVHL